MLTDIIHGFRQQSLWNKIVFCKKVIFELTILSVSAFVFFWITFSFLATISLFISPQPYYYEFTPVYHVRHLIPESLFTLFVNQQLMQTQCSLIDQGGFFSELTLPYHEFCNLKQEYIPGLYGKTNVALYGVDSTKVRYVSGCTRILGQKTSCQKYPVSDKISLFRQIQLSKAYFIQIQLHLYDSKLVPEQTGTLQMVQENNFVIRFIKDHYHLFSIIITYGITISFTITAILIRISFLAKDYILQENSSQITDSNKAKMTKQL